MNKLNKYTINTNTSIIHNIEKYIYIQYIHTCIFIDIELNIYTYKYVYIYIDLFTIFLGMIEYICSKKHHIT